MVSRGKYHKHNLLHSCDDQEQQSAIAHILLDCHTNEILNQFILPAGQLLTRSGTPAYLTVKELILDLQTCAHLNTHLSGAIWDGIRLFKCHPKKPGDKESLRLCLTTSTYNTIFEKDGRSYNVPFSTPPFLAKLVPTGITDTEFVHSGYIVLLSALSVDYLNPTKWRDLGSVLPNHTSG